MASFCEKLRGSNYDWDDLQRLVRLSKWIEPDEIVATVERQLAVLLQLSEIELQVIDDAKSGWNIPLAERLRTEIIRIFLAS